MIFDENPFEPFVGNMWQETVFDIARGICINEANGLDYKHRRLDKKRTTPNPVVQRIQKNCLRCNSVYTTTIGMKDRSKFCQDKCKKAYRRSKLDHRV